ncbi:MAG: hypothetical protein LBL49_06215 [Clostridiales Family XIII bacterium]|nr:hypothetical protein [Clostridiales Family XIII bacterium]
MEKISWNGTILSIQPRTNVWRYRIDNRTHSHTGYNLFLDGIANGEAKQFAVAISEKQQQTLGFRIGDEASGTGWTKKYPQWEYADYYRAGALKRVKPNYTLADESKMPPWTDGPPDMATYEWRGCRVLSKACWKGKCFKCKWATMANVTIEYDWGVKQKWRFESFCYGPKSCKFYKRGAEPMVPYKNCGSNPDCHGGFDDIFTENRDWDD